MAYSSGRRQCAMDTNCKQSGVYNCAGCSKSFCLKHVADHRRKLNEEMNEIISEHDSLKNIFIQHASSPNLHPLIKQVDEWEKESIAKIQQKAKELREQLLEPTSKQINELSKRLAPFTEQLTQARELDDFVETDLSLWKVKLGLIKSDLTSPLNFCITEEENAPLVRNTSVMLKNINEQFDRVFDDKVRVVEDGKVVIHDGPDGWKEIRGKNEYSSGRHKIRLRVESSCNSSIMLGINSKTTPLQSNSHKSKSACLWYNSNYAYSGGVEQTNKSGSAIEMRTNDIISLIFDCDNLKISMANERTNAIHELTVILNNCPFPWQLHAALYHTQASLRILPQ